jgi:hypothetical protein
VLKLKFHGRLKDIYKDRKDEAVYRPALIQYLKKDSIFNLNIQVKTRGHFRRMASNCELPPLLININKSSKLKNTLFEKQDKLKLVMPCVDNEEYVIKEYLVYKLYNLFTPLSFNARLAQIEFLDSLNKKKPETHFCILLEDEKTLARRNKYMAGAATRASRGQIDQKHFQLMSLFQFMIGNTDWSVEYLHNLKLLYKDSLAKPNTIPYDFDHSGIVNAPYAHPAEELGLQSVQERLFVGNCLMLKDAEPYVKRFNELKEKVYDIYSTCTLLDAKSIKAATNYLDEFYRIINNSKALEKYLLPSCSNQQRVIIKGYENE